MNGKIKLALIILVCVGAISLGYLINDKSDASDSLEVADSVTEQTESQDTAAPTDSTWFKRCDAPKKGADNQKPHCEIFQTLSVKETKQKFLEFAVGYNGDPDPVSAQAVIILPLGIAVNAGGIMQIDDEEGGEKFIIKTCAPSGCIASFTLKPEFLAKMKSGKNMYISFVDNQNKTRKTQMPLQGFSATLKSLQL